MAEIPETPAEFFDPIAALADMGVKGLPEEIDPEEVALHAQGAGTFLNGEMIDSDGTLVLGNGPGVTLPGTLVLGGGGGSIAGGVDPYAAQRSAQAGGTTAMRFNQGKLRYDLLPPEGIEELVRIYTMGAEKYAPRNWEKGLSWTGCFASMCRHAFAWLGGQDNDPESGLNHMAHVAWNAIAIVVYTKRGVGQDDRA